MNRRNNLNQGIERLRITDNEVPISSFTQVWDNFAKNLLESLPREQAALVDSLPKALVFFKKIFGHRSFRKFRDFWTDGEYPPFAISIEEISLPNRIASYDGPKVRRFIGLLQNFYPSEYSATHQYHFILILLAGSEVLEEVSSGDTRQHLGGNALDSSQHARTAYEYILDEYTDPALPFIRYLDELQFPESGANYIVSVIYKLQRRFGPGATTLLHPDFPYRYDCLDILMLQKKCSH